MKTMHQDRINPRRWLALVALLTLAVPLAACSPDTPQEAAQEAVENKAETVAETVESQAETVAETVESKAETVAGTVEAKAEGAEQMAEDLGDAAGELRGWTEDTVKSLGSLSEQATLLQADPSQMSDNGWQRQTQDVLDELTKQSTAATEAATSLQTEGKAPMIQSALTTLGIQVGELATECSTALAAGDADAFLLATEKLTEVTAAIEKIQPLLGNS